MLQVQYPNLHIFLCLVQFEKARVVSYNAEDTENPYFCCCALKAAMCPHKTYLKIHIRAEYESRQNNNRYVSTEGMFPRAVQ